MATMAFAVTEINTQCHFTVVHSVTWPLNSSKARGDLAFDADLSAFVE